MKLDLSCKNHGLVFLSNKEKLDVSVKSKGVVCVCVRMINKGCLSIIITWIGSQNKVGYIEGI